ncbi:MAG: serine/threonine-protein kinase [Chthoniobacterales bacterium]
MTASVCPRCGSGRESSALPELGCIVCALELALGRTTDTGEAPPLAFGQYLIETREDGQLWELGRGAMGVTYRAIDRSLQRTVALKIIAADFAARGSEARERFVREARAAAALRHPNVATAYQFGIEEETGQSFYAMELVEGETLEERVRRSGPLDVRSVVEIALQVTAALGEAEKRGLVHRDLKPSNIMIASGEEAERLTVKVIDFGLAKAWAEAPEARMLTHNGFVGTPAFASPEQLRSAPVDVRSDIYSLGATLWYLLTGRTPFGDHAGAGPPPVEQLKAAHVPPRLAALLTSMVATEPAARPSVDDLGRQLQAMQERRKLPLSWALAAGFIVLAAGATFFSLRPSLKPAPVTKAVAVLPFDHPGANQTGELLASGLQDDILVSLSKIADLKVISRNSVAHYADTKKDPGEIGRELGVDAVLVGSLRQAGPRARVNVALLRGTDGTQIWASGFDRELNDVFAIQSDLALQVASALKATVLPMEANGIRSRPTNDPQAYLLYVQAQDLFVDPEKPRPKLEKVERLLGQAVERDPKFALAFALLSNTETIFADEYDPTPARACFAEAAKSAPL